MIQRTSVQWSSESDTEHIDFTQHGQRLAWVEKYPQDQEEKPYYGLHMPTRKSIGSVLAVIQDQLQTSMPPDFAPQEWERISVLTSEGRVDNIPIKDVLQANDLPNFNNAQIDKMAIRYDFEMPEGEVFQVDAWARVGRLTAADQPMFHMKELSYISGANLAPQIAEAYDVLTAKKRRKWVDISALREAIKDELAEYSSLEDVLSLRHFEKSA